MSEVSFTVSREVSATIELVAARYRALLKAKGLPRVDSLDLHMDLTALGGKPSRWCRSTRTLHQATWPRTPGRSSFGQSQRISSNRNHYRKRREALLRKGSSWPALHDSNV